MSRHKTHLDPETGAPFYPLAHAQDEKISEHHTPLPWAATTRQGSWDWVIYSTKDPNIEICQLFHDGTEDNEVGEANADLIVKAVNAFGSRTPAAVEPAQCEDGSRLSPRQQASKMLFGDIHWVDREDMSDLMDDEFVYDDGSHKRNISPNALITELEAAQQGIDAIIAKLDACLVPDNVLDEVRSALTAARTPAGCAAPTIDDIPSCGQENDYRRARPTPAASEGPFNAEMPSSLNDACRRLDLAQERISQLEAQVERAEKILQSTGMQATIQEAIMRHPHYSGSATFAYGLAGTALKAVRASFTSTERQDG